MAVVQRGITITQPSTVTATDFNNLVDLATVSNVLVADIDASAKDPAAATPGLRTLGSGATQAAAGNHTHSIGSSDLVDGAVTNAKLADMAQDTIKGRGYLRARAASTADVSITSAPATIDGVTLVNSDRVLLKNQTAGAENGIRIFAAAASPMARAQDFDSASEILFDTDIAIAEGVTNAGTNWTLTTTGTIVVDTTALTFAAASGGGRAQDMTPAQARDVLDLEPDDSTLEIASGNIRVKDLGITGAKIAPDTITADKFASGVSATISKYKPVQEDLTNDSTLQSDDELFFNMIANGVYQFKFFLFVSTTNAANIKVALTGPSGLGNLRAAVTYPRYDGDGQEIARAGATITSYGSSRTADYTSTSTDVWVVIEGTIENGGTAGGLTLQWAQGTAQPATTTTVKRGSYVTAHKL